ncbi:MAG: hypothetical protein LIO79_01530 [Rikenellaceae bacterium]|nr:hypothetical protein [Rikenellaceae bacterium]
MITEIIRQAAAMNGINFGSGFSEELLDRELNFPIIWMEPFVVTATDCNYPVKNYTVTLHLLDLPSTDSQPEYEALNKKIAEITMSLTNVPLILSMVKLKTSPNKYPLTNYGDISISFSIEITTIDPE